MSLAIRDNDVAPDEWVKANLITEIECLVPDLSGIARGKILPSDTFLRNYGEGGLRLPESVLACTVTGENPETAYEIISRAEIDVRMAPDPTTLRVVPWYTEPTAQVICDCHYADGRAVPFAPRQVLRGVLDLYEAQGWRAVLAPELEFFLVKINTDPDYPLEPPVGRSGREESGRQQYGIDAVNEFEPLFEDIYEYCETQDVDVDTLSHEAGAAQMEINFSHGDPLDLADQVFLFKRIVREAAIRHNLYATFMAKPIQNEPGSAMHVHQSVVRGTSGRNLFVDKAGDDSDLFRYFLGGLQRYLPDAMPLVAPNVNSYRRLAPNFDAPVNIQWGYDNRTVGLRMPHSSPTSRRIENRVPGADANPYLVIAATLACGLLGTLDEVEPAPPVVGSAYDLPLSLPRHLPDAIARFQASKALRGVLGDAFIDMLTHVKTRSGTPISG